MPDRADDADRFAGYRRARLRVHGFAGRTLVLRPAAPGTVEGPFPFDGSVHVLTAFDPGPVRLTTAENARRQQALVDDLPAQLPRWATETGADDGSHTEAGVLVAGLTDDEARAHGRRYGQDAVFRWSADAWSVLPCDGGPAQDQGWVVSG